MAHDSGEPNSSEERGPRQSAGSRQPHRPRQLADRPWPEVSRPVVCLPFGSIEQHGPHLPLDTDTAVATAVAQRLAGRLAAAGTDVVMAPPVAYGSSGEHEHFAGTVSIGRDALEVLLLEYGRSACRWAEKLVIVNGHGGNVDVLTAAVPRLVHEGRDVAWLGCVPEAPDGDDGGAPLDAHAGRVETSLMLHLQPERVHLDRAEPGNTEPLRALLPELRRGGVAGVAANGILGDPRGASAAEGERLLSAMVEAAWRDYVAWTPTASGRLVA
ncbi:mycofactocin biosynthesis peptidyl-dipeptidase MftE [Georgenia halophila]|uniref:Mycofactocin biosynthesis peptidyl-dipeptidase MftE n=1 Tax=Georgenia halophila TaxID=620889 RepID=A0ABP8KV53_9MICO